MERVEYLLSQGQVDQLMEEVVSLYQQAAQNVDAVIVEGLVPDQKQVFSTFLNTKIARNLQAQTILVSSVKELGAAEIAEQLEMNIQPSAARPSPATSSTTCCPPSTAPSWRARCGNPAT